MRGAVLRHGRGGYRDPLTTWRPENCSPSGVAIANGRAFIGALRGHALWAVRLSGPNKGRRARYFHERFGRGILVSVAGAGQESEATVEFVAEGAKRLLLAYAPLKNI